MTLDLPAAKAEARRRLRDALAGLSPAARQVESERLCRRLAAAPFWLEARTVLAFMPLPDEPDLEPLLREATREGRILLLPYYRPGSRDYGAREVTNLEGDVARGHFGIREPTPHCREGAVNRLDLILVPGVGFTPDGRRLGRGRGYYDRLLAGARGLTCGVCFDAQMAEALPCGPNDIRLDSVLTPSRVYP